MSEAEFHVLVRLIQEKTSLHVAGNMAILPAELMVTLAYMAAGADPQQVFPELLALETGRAN